MPLWMVYLWLAALSVPLAVVFLAAMTISERLWRSSSLIAPLIGTVGLALAALISFIAYWINPIAGMVCASVMLAGSVAIFARGRLWSRWREAIPVIALLSCVIVFALAFTYLWGADGDPYSVVASRYFHFMLPSDSTIPELFAERLISGQGSSLLIGDWNGGDRPPLQAGLELLISPLIAIGQALFGKTAVGLGGAMPHGASFAVDVLAQFLWIPVGYVLLRLLRFRRRVAITALVFASFVPTVLVNSVYTWPKMLSAALVLAAIGFMLSSSLAKSTGAWPMVLAVVAATLGVLAHGAAAFAVPALVIIGLYTLRGRGIRSSLRTLSMAGVAGIALYAPWFIYQRYIDPPGDRLLKWHFAGFVPVTPESFSDVVLRQYAQTPVKEIIHNRVANIETLIGIDQLWRIDAPNVDLVTSLRVLDWTSTTSALGIIAVSAGAAMLLWHSRHFRALDVAGRQRLVVFVSMLPCIAIWILLLFSAHASIVPQGSHVWILAMVIIPFAWLFERRPRLAAILLAIQALSCVSVYFIPLDAEARVQEIALPQLLLVIVALVISTVAPWMFLQHRPAKHALIS